MRLIGVRNFLVLRCAGRVLNQNRCGTMFYLNFIIQRNSPSRFPLKRMQGRYRGTSALRNLVVVWCWHPRSGRPRRHGLGMHPRGKLRMHHAWRGTHAGHSASNCHMPSCRYQVFMHCYQYNPGLLQGTLSHHRPPLPRLLRLKVVLRQCRSTK
jgi:hypothetical protein